MLCFDGESGLKLQIERLILSLLAHCYSPIMDHSMNMQSDESDTTDSHQAYGSIPYGGIPENIREQLLVGRADDGWAARRGDARDWGMSRSPQWGEVIDQKVIDPLVNLRSDFDICGLEWNGPVDRDTSLDKLETEDWAQIQRKCIRITTS